MLPLFSLAHQAVDAKCYTVSAVNWYVDCVTCSHKTLESFHKIMTISRVHNKSGFNHHHSLERATIRSTIRRHCYTFAKKMKVVEAAYNMQMEEHLSLTDSAKVLKVHPTMIYRWAKKKNTDDANIQSLFQLHPGPTSILHDIEQDLVDFVEEWRQKGLPVNRYSLVKKVIQLKPEFSEKSEHAAKMSISRFLARNNLTHRMATHTGQRQPAEVYAEAVCYLDVIRPRLLEANVDLDYVINMDQTAVYHAMNAKYSIHKKNEKTINLRTSAADTKRISVAVTITASGKRVKSMVVFKVS